MKANQQYEQGFKEVKSKFDGIFKKPVSDEANIKIQQDYKKQALEQMKAIAATDLSDPKNVQIAEDIMTPFYEDRLLLQDQVWTSQLENEYSKAEQVRNSDDENIKRTFDPESLGPLDAVKEELRFAGRNPEKYKKISIPSWTPFIDVGTYLNEWKIKDKPEISWEDNLWFNPATGKEEFDPTRKFKHVNGPKSLPGWYTMTNRQIDGKFDPQYTVKGTNAYNRTIKDYISTHKGATEDDARNYIASTMYKEMLDIKKKHLNNIDTEVVDNKRRIQKLEEAKKRNPHGLTKDQEHTLEQLKTNVATLEPVLQKATADYDDFSKPDRVNQFGKNYIINQLGNTIRQRDVENYAKGFAADTKGSSVSKDDAFFAMAQLNEEIRKNNQTATYQREQLKIQRGQLNVQEFNALTERIKAINGPNGAKGSSAVSTGTPLIPQSRVSRKATEDLTKKSEYEIYAELLNNDNKTIGQNFYGVPATEGANQYGAISKILLGGTVGLNLDEFDAINKYQLMYHNGTLPLNAKGKFQLTVAEGKFYNSGISKLSKATGLTINTPADVTTAISKYANDFLSKSMYDGSNMPELKYYSTLITNTNKLYNSLKTEVDLTNSQIAYKVAQNPERYGPIAVKDDRGTHIISNADIMPYSFSMTAVDDAGNKYEFSKDDIAKKYIQGRVKTPYSAVANKPFLEIDGKELYPLTINGKDYQREFEKAHPSGFGQWYYSDQLTSKNGIYPHPEAQQNAVQLVGRITSKFGKSSDIADNLAKISQDVIAHSEYYKKLTGAVNTVITIDITGDGEDNVDYIKDALATGNRYSLETDDGELVTDQETIKKLQSLSNDENLSKYIGRSFDAELSDRTGTSKIIIDIPKTSDPNDKYADISGQRYKVAISPDTKSELLRNIPVEKTRERWHPLYSDDPSQNVIKASDTYQSMGIDGRLSLSKEQGVYNANISYEDVDTASGRPITKYEQIPIPSSKSAIEATQIFDDALKLALNTKLANKLIYINKQGTNR